MITKEQVLSHPKVIDALAMLAKYSGETICEDTLIDIFNEADYQWNTGCTRFVILDDDWDFVLKIAIYSYQNEDANLTEFNNYKKAEEFGVEKVLLPTLPLVDLGLKNGLIYYQPKFSTSISDFRWSETEEAEEFSNRYLQLSHSDFIENLQDKFCDGNRLDPLWLACVFSLFGEEFCEKLALWSKKNGVNDLHNSNTGLLNGKPVIIDYAGF